MRVMYLDCNVNGCVYVLDEIRTTAHCGIDREFRIVADSLFCVDGIRLCVCVFRLLHRGQRRRRRRRCWQRPALSMLTSWRVGLLVVIVTPQTERTLTTSSH